MWCTSFYFRSQCPNKCPKKVFTKYGSNARIYSAMPVTSSAIKKAKQDKKARERNRLVRDSYKKASKEVRKLVKAGDLKKANAALTIAYSKLDKAAKKNILHLNNASRKKARLATLIGKNEKVSKKSAPKP